MFDQSHEMIRWSSGSFCLGWFGWNPFKTEFSQCLEDKQKFHRKCKKPKHLSTPSLPNVFPTILLPLSTIWAQAINSGKVVNRNPGPSTGGVKIDFLNLFYRFLNFGSSQNNYTELCHTNFLIRVYMALSRAELSL